MLKADSKHVESIDKRVTNWIRDIDVKQQKQQDELLTLEHYTERYVPV